MQTPAKRRPGRPATGQTRNRSMRLGDVYDEAQKIAAARGDRLSKIVEDALAAYVAQHRTQQVVSLPPASPYDSRTPVPAGEIDLLTAIRYDPVITLPRGEHQCMLRAQGGRWVWHSYDLGKPREQPHEVWEATDEAGAREWLAAVGHPIPD